MRAAAIAVGVIALAGCGSASGPKSPRQTFAGTCGSCHTLQAAGTNGTFGPSLDRLKPSRALVRATIAKGPGAMPAHLLTGTQAAAVARYVASASGG